MAYFLRDIGGSYIGDITTDGRGDLSLAEPIDSYKDTLRWLMATDFGGMKPQPRFGSNLGSLIGRNDMERMLELIPTMVRDGLIYQGLFDTSMVKVLAIPIDVDNILVYVMVQGEFYDSDWNIVRGEDITLRFLFPYTQEPIAEITD